MGPPRLSSPIARIEFEQSRFHDENNKDYSYTYDLNGNIITISLNGSLQQTFTYNSSNELVRVDDAAANKTITYEYDYVGNITSVKTYAYTTGSLGTPLTTQNYTYNSQNQRTDLGYDANGNMTALNGYSFTWANRRLTSATSADNSISYTYNHSGIRTSKTVNGTATYYEVDEKNNVIKQYELANNAETNVIEFVYGSDGSPVYFTYNNATYYYEKNMQGDIVGILDANGNTVVEYSYDIWGKLLSITGSLANTIGQINPLRYRGYYYDTETSLYYLQSRYYSPELMRFISQDDPVLSNLQGLPLGSNLYIYCLNNPVMNNDPSGTVSIGAIIGGIIGFGVGAIIMPIFADMLRLHGWKRTVFIVGGTAALTAIGSLLGYYAGKALVTLYAKGGVFSQKLNAAIAKVIRKFTGATLKSASGNGWTLTLKKYMVRIMSSGGGRTNYIRISHATKGAMTIAGMFSNERAVTHIPITVSNLVKLIGLMLKWR